MRGRDELTEEVPHPASGLTFWKAQRKLRAVQTLETMRKEVAEKYTSKVREYEVKLEQITSVADELHAQLITERSRHEKEVDELRAAHSAAIIEIRRTSVSQSEFDRVVAKLTEQAKILKDKLQRVRDDYSLKYSLERMDLEEKTSDLDHENGLLRLRVDEMKIKSAQGSLSNGDGRRRSAVVAIELEEVCKDLANRQKALNDLESSLAARERRLLSRESSIIRRENESFNTATKDQNRSTNETSSQRIGEDTSSSTTEKALSETIHLRKIIEDILSMTMRST